MVFKVRIFDTVLAQKSLSMLSRADCSMIWNSFIFDKKYKWLSYNLWFFYIQFYKVIFFFDFTINKNFKLLNHLYKKNILQSKKHKFKISSVTPRFSYYIDLYCLEFLNQLILLNLYFFTNLEFYKKKTLSRFNYIDRQYVKSELVNISYTQDSVKTLSSQSETLYATFF